MQWPKKPIYLADGKVIQISFIITSKVFFSKLNIFFLILKEHKSKRLKLNVIVRGRDTESGKIHEVLL